MTIKMKGNHVIRVKTKDMWAFHMYAGPHIEVSRLNTMCMEILYVVFILARYSKRSRPFKHPIQIGKSMSPQYVSGVVSFTFPPLYTPLGPTMRWKLKKPFFHPYRPSQALNELGTRTSAPSSEQVVCCSPGNGPFFNGFGVLFSPSFKLLLAAFFLHKIGLLVSTKLQSNHLESHHIITHKFISIST